MNEKEIKKTGKRNKSIDGDTYIFGGNHGA